MTIPISLAVGKSESIAVQNQDISWGGVKFVVPKKALPESKTVTMRFPWTKGDSFSASAEILRKEDLDEEHAIVAARFSSLSTSDQRRLEKLLMMLQGVGDESRRRSEPLVPVLEVLFSDPEEIRTKLDEIASGRLAVIVFEMYQAGQSIRLVLGGIADQPALRLRARVEEVQFLTTETDSAWPMFEVRLRFEHPAQELKAAAESLIERLPRRSPMREEHSQGDLTIEGE